MKTKLILDLTNLPNSDRTHIMSMVQLALMATGFTWSDGSIGPRDLDGDALVINHPKNDSPQHLLLYKRGRFSAGRREVEKEFEDTLVFDANVDSEFASFLDGVKFHRSVRGVRSQPPKLDLSQAEQDHLKRPLGWSGRDTHDPVWTEMVGKVKLSVCQHVAMTSVPGEALSAEEISTIENRIRAITRDKFGFEADPLRMG